MPFIVRWPAGIKPGVSSALVCQVDLLATFSVLVERPLPSNAGPDSINILPALLGKSETGREELVEQGAGLSYRKGAWKLVNGARAGAGVAAKKKQAPVPVELYDLSVDLGETKDLSADHADLVKELADRLDHIRRDGRSRP